MAILDSFFTPDRDVNVVLPVKLKPRKLIIDVNKNKFDNDIKILLLNPKIPEKTKTTKDHKTPNTPAFNENIRNGSTGITIGNTTLPMVIAIP